jgi:hypothetical protein
MAAKRSKAIKKTSKAVATRLPYWVVGGEYRNPSRPETVIGQESWLGPFKSKAEAMEVWKEWAWKTVDHAQVRYRIERRARKPAAAD